MERKYTKQEFLKAAEIGEVSMIDAKHVVSLLDEARAALKGTPLYLFIPIEGNHSLSVCNICDLIERCDGDSESFCRQYPCTTKEREDGKNGYYKKNF